jgi:uncharacterized protein
MAGACAGYHVQMSPAIRALAAGETDRAVELLDRDADPGSVVWQMERGLLLRAAGRFQESNEAFAAALRRQEDLFTRSVSNEAAALVVNDLVRPYRAPAHELPFLHLYAAMNYLDLGDREGAQVEARALSRMLEERVRPGEEGGAADWGFGRLFAGMVLESGGEWNDAWIAYRAARGAYEAQADQPAADLKALLDEAIARTAVLAGIEAGDFLPPRPRLVVVVEEGLVTPLEELHLRVPILREEEDWDEARLDEWSVRVGSRAQEVRRDQWTNHDHEVAYLIDLALPFYPPRAEEPPPPRVTVTAQGPGEEVRTIVAEDVEGRAREELDRAYPVIAARAAARALLKFLASRAAEKKSGELAGQLANLFGVMSEQADTRSWETLPKRISLAVLELPAGAVAASVVSATGETSAAVDATVPEGGMAFLDCRLLP